MIASRIGNSVVLAALNLTAIIVGLTLFTISDNWFPFLLQGAASVAFGATLVVLWLVLPLTGTRRHLDAEFVYVFLGAFPVAGIVAAAVLSRFAENGWQLAGFVSAVWAAQFVVNSLGAAISASICRRTVCVS